jgi:hypothetical protein
MIAGHYINSTIRAAASVLLALLLMLAPASAAELHSNGLGGGDWSDPLSWREKAVPTSDDDAVISRGDVIAFDRDDEGKTTCKQIFIDPKGALAFKTGKGRTVCSVAGPIEAFGSILIDGTRSAADKCELRMVGATAADRTIKLMKGGKLTVAGRRNLAHGRHNVTLGSAASEAGKPPLETTIEARDGSSLDVQRAEFLNVHLTAFDLDNTGAEVDERVHIVGNHFSGVSHLSITSCDSPLIADNLIELSGVPSFAPSAIYLILCPLAEIRGNTVRGRYAIGIQARQMVDSALTDSVFEGCATGVYWYGTNGMLKQLTARNCDTGVTCTSMSGVLEDIRIENCKTGYYHAIATVQMTNVQIVDVPKDGVVISYYAGPLKLLNCNITPEQIKPVPKAPVKAKDGVAAIECLHYLVVRATGNVPRDARIEVRTAGPSAAKSPRAADPFVRNSPSPIRSNGLTMLPDTLEPLIVRGWTYDDDVKPVAAPSYVVSVVPPASAAGDPPKPLVSTTVTPDASWYRAEPNKPEPTVEVKTP